MLSIRNQIYAYDNSVLPSELLARIIKKISSKYYTTPFLAIRLVSKQFKAVVDQIIFPKCFKVNYSCHFGSYARIHLQVYLFALMHLYRPRNMHPDLDHNLIANSPSFLLLTMSEAGPEYEFMEALNNLCSVNNVTYQDILEAFIIYNIDLDLDTIEKAIKILLRRQRFILANNLFRVVNTKFKLCQDNFNRILKLACSYGNIHLVEKLLNDSRYSSFVFDKRNSPIIAAICSRNKETNCDILKLLLADERSKQLLDKSIGDYKLRNVEVANISQKILDVECMLKLAVASRSLNVADYLIDSFHIDSYRQFVFLIVTNQDQNFARYLVSHPKFIIYAQKILIDLELFSEVDLEEMRHGFLSGNFPD